MYFHEVKSTAHPPIIGAHGRSIGDPTISFRDPTRPFGDPARPFGDVVNHQLDDICHCYLVGGGGNPMGTSKSKPRSMTPQT